MLLPQQSLGRYSLVSTGQHDEFDIQVIPKGKRKPYYLFSILCVALLCLPIGLIGNALLLNTQRAHLQSYQACKDPAVRQEWRSLSRRERNDYLEAVQCLKTTPSRLARNQSLYDDFPWVHTLVGGYSHGAAAFLTWHRYFLHVYERALREQCGYGGHLTYWNWALDWEDLTKSPIWDSEGGFGGNGDPRIGDPFFSGYCVVDGPFADLEVLYVGADYKPHCLSRGFESGEKLARLGEGVKPGIVEELLSRPDNESFNLGLEDGPHLIIPKSIRGDFKFFTAPNDPVFFLHHTQLDRMWWTWQQAYAQKRQTEYGGKAAMNSTQRASLSDVVPMGTMLADIKVSEIMSTETELLCYRY